MRHDVGIVEMALMHLSISKGASRFNIESFGEHEALAVDFFNSLSPMLIHRP